MKTPFERFMAHLCGLGSVALFAGCVYFGVTPVGGAIYGVNVIFLLPGFFFGWHAWQYLKWLGA